MTKDAQFVQARQDVFDNLDAIKLSLTQCVDAGMADPDDNYYNELLGLIEDTRIVNTWDELMEIITLAKTIEIDVAGWLSFHGRTTLSLPWPKKSIKG